MSIYALKPKFQNLLRPIVKRLYQKGITANQVTLFACAVSIFDRVLLLALFAGVSTLFLAFTDLVVCPYGTECDGRYVGTGVRPAIGIRRLFE